MTLLDLAVKIGVDDQASDAASKIGESIGNGLKRAAQIGIAAVGALSTAVVKYASDSIEAYADYEQLAGGVDTLFKTSADKVKGYAAEAYRTAGLSANEYMATVTSFSASLLQSLATGTSASTENVEAELERQYEALQEANDESEEALSESHDAEIKAFRALTDEKIEMIEAQYLEQIRLVDEERYNQLKAIDDEIAAINGLSEAEEKARVQREREEKKAELQRQVDTASSARFREVAEKNLSKYLAEIAKEDAETERKRRVKQLEDDKKAINTEANEKIKLLNEEKDAEIEAVKKAEDEQLEIIQKRHKTELKNLKSANSQKLKEMKDYISKQSEYLAQASSGVAEYTEETYSLAADYADMAIRDMADNVNTFGTDIERVQAAYQGLARANFTMLDNLALPYKGTREEMERLIADANALKVANGEMADLSIENFADMVEAIHLIQQSMGMTGRTTDEAATTIEGSTTMMKKAWENLKTGISDENADIDKLIDDFVLSAETAGNNLITRATSTVDGIKAVFEDPEKRQKFVELGKTLLSKVAEGMKAILGIEDDENPITWAAKTLRGFIVKCTEYLSENSGEFYNIGTGILKAIWDGLAADDDGTGRSASFIVGKIIGDIAKSIFDSTVALLETIGNIQFTIADFIVALFTGDTAKLTEYGQKIEGVFSDFFAGIGYGIDPTSGHVADIVEDRREGPAAGRGNAGPDLSAAIPNSTKTAVGGTGITNNFYYANPNVDSSEIERNFETALELFKEANGGVYYDE